MKFIMLEHARDLGYPRSKDYHVVDSSEFMHSSGDTFVSFRPVKGKVPDEYIKNIDACKRFLGRFQGNLLFYMLAEDSEFAPVIFWDSAHSLKIGNKIVVFGDASYYKRAYFSGCFSVIETMGNYTVFEKVAALPAEQDAGLEDWTFGIPVGPGDATALNGVVKRILELACAQKEIILCGRPGRNFKYWDKVRIVGEDIPAPPVQICRKKNTIARNARYHNLCIIHDRVFLPRDFMEGMRRYGDCFGFLGMQSMYFGDYLNRKIIRYSDYGLIISDKFNNDSFFSGNAGERKTLTHRYRSFYQKEGEFYCANPRRYLGTRYLTGSLYICKKRVWEHCPQDESLVWEDYEDVIHGQTAMAQGILVGVNPYLFSQSIFGRQLVIGNGITHYENARGRYKRKSFYFPCLHGKQKPFLNVSQEIFLNKVHDFMAKYHVTGRIPALSKKEIHAEDRLKIIFFCVLRARLYRKEEAVQEFVRDIQKNLFQRTFAPADCDFWVKQFCKLEGSRAKADFLKWAYCMVDVILCDKNKVFAYSAKDYFVQDSFLCRVATFLTALRLCVQNKDVFYHPDGCRGFYRAILASTPWKSYVEDES